MPRPRYIVIALALLALLVPASAAAKVPKGFFGVEAEAPTDHDFKRIAQTGFGAHRYVFNWRAIQKTRKGGYLWGQTDLRLKQAAEQGIRTTIVLVGTPRFVKKKPNGFYPPRSGQDLKAWSNFVEAAAKRYGRDGSFWNENPGLDAKPVHDWIAWNEQNARNFWRPKPNPRDYAKLVKRTDRALSKADPGADVVLGGMYGYPKDASSYKATDFLRKLYAVKGIEKHFEAINLHPYGGGVGAVRKQIKQARAAVRKAGDKRVKVLIGEVGWASFGNPRSNQVVGERGQAKRLSQALKLFVHKRKAWNLLGSFIYTWRDPQIATPCLWCPGAGLVKGNGKAKPALKAVRKVIQGAR
jgi:hypothetical protein